MKKVLITALLLVSANIVLANEFRNRLTQQDTSAAVMLSQQELAALEEISAGVNANVHMH